MDANTPGEIGDPKHSVVFPLGDEMGMRSLSVIIHMLGCSVLAYSLALRSQNVDIFSYRGLRSISWPRWLLLLLFVDSWIFIFLAGVLVNGVGMSISNLACQLGILLCIVFYALSKVLIYLFLIERVYIVWPNKGTTRWSSTAYRVCLGGVLIYGVIFVLLLFGRIAYIQEDQQCVIGLEKLASLSLLLYDLFLNVFLTGMFLYPLQQNQFISSKLRLVARRTLAAATMALITSAVNVAILIILHGREYGWVCLASCGTDTVLNAMVVIWVTSPQDDQYLAHQGPLVDDALAGSTHPAGIERFTLPSDRKSSNSPNASTYSMDAALPRVRSKLEDVRPISVHAPTTSRVGYLDCGSARRDARPVLTDIEEVEVRRQSQIGRGPTRDHPGKLPHRRKKSPGWLNMLAQVFGLDELDEDVGGVSVQVTVTTQTSTAHHQPRPESNVLSGPESRAQTLDLNNEDRPPIQPYDPKDSIES